MKPSIYVDCISPLTNEIFPKMRGIIAPPAIAIIRRALPFAVYFPRPSKASGQIVGQTSAFAKPRRATKVMVSGRVCIPLHPHKISDIVELYPEDSTTPKRNKIPKTAEPISAFSWERYLGIKTTPTK